MAMRYVGDSIWTLPFFDNIRINFPEAEIAVVANKGADIFYKRSSAIDLVIQFPKDEVGFSLKGAVAMLRFLIQLRRLKPDLVLDITDSDKSSLFSFISGGRQRIVYSMYRKWRSWFYTDSLMPDYNLHMVDYYLHFLELLGLRVSEKGVRLSRSHEALQSLLSRFPVAALTDRKKILIHLGARIELRQWGTDMYARLVRLLSPRYSIFIVAGPSEEMLLKEMADRGVVADIFTSSLTLDEFSELCAISDIFVGNDSGPIHVASAAGTFVIGIYGPNTDASAGPWTDRKMIFEQKGMPCRPCNQGGCSNPDYKACLRSTAPEDLAVAVDSFLAGGEISG